MDAWLDRLNDRGIAFCGVPSRVGIEVRSREELTITRYRKPPRSRRRQIWRKWMATKRIVEPDPQIYVIGGVIFGHPATIANLKDRLERGEIQSPTEFETTI